MTKHKKNHKPTSKKQHLEFEEAKKMTVEEAVRKDNHLKAGIKESDSVLDRYIKQHREEIGAKKFETQSLKLSDVSLTDSEREQEEIVKETVVLDTSKQANDINHEDVADDVFEEEVIEEMDSVLLEQSKPLPSSSSKKRVWLAVGLMALLLGGVGGGYLLSGQRTSNPSNDKSNIVTPKTDKDSNLKKADAEVKKTFDDLYASFFVDEAKTQLKNDQFDKLPDLEKALKALEGTSDYTAAKALFDRLSKQVDALNKLNAQFTNPVIVDGNRVDSPILDTANFDQLGSDVLNTGNPSLDNLIQSAISNGRQQQSEKAQEAIAAQQAQAQADAQAAANQASATAPAIPAVDTTTGQTWSTSQAPAPSGTASPAATSYGITNYNPSILQRHLSRVPYNHDLVADVNNPAWIFGEGVLERILETSRARGYIVGNDFILERVNIINGNGYYNMFKPDGTYLFSINAKTGYFVGNGRGYADALDY